MELATILQAISTVGFPIVMCLAMLWYIRELTSNHKEEISKFTEALNNNTVALQELCDKLGVEREGVTK